MTTSIFPDRVLPCLKVDGLTATYQITRIFCVGRNYAEHAAEMGNEVDREAPFYFTKSAFAYVPSGGRIPYSPGTENLHHEMEFVVAMGSSVFKASREDAMAAVYGYGCGLDMTRRDLQQASKDKRRSWDTGKDFENSAVLTGLVKRDQFGEVGPQRIFLNVNSEPRQDAILADMVWQVDEIVSHLSHLYHLGPGDLIMTGTPAGVGPVVPGDKLSGGIDGLPGIELEISDPE